MDQKELDDSAKLKQDLLVYQSQVEEAQKWVSGVKKIAQDERHTAIRMSHHHTQNLEEAHRVIASQREQLSEIDAQLDQSKKEKQIFFNQLQEEQYVTQTLSKKLQECHREIDNLRKMSASLEKQISFAAEYRQQVDQNRSQLQDSIHDLQELLSSRNSQIFQLKSQLLQKSKGQDDSVVELEESVSNLRKQLIHQKNTIELLKSEIQQAQDRTADANRSAEKREKRLRNMNSIFNFLRDAVFDFSNLTRTQCVKTRENFTVCTHNMLSLAEKWKHYLESQKESIQVTNMANFNFNRTENKTERHRILLSWHQQLHDQSGNFGDEDLARVEAILGLLESTYLVVEELNDSLHDTQNLSCELERFDVLFHERSNHWKNFLKKREKELDTANTNVSCSIFFYLIVFFFF